MIYNWDREKHLKVLPFLTIPFSPLVLCGTIVTLSMLQDRPQVVSEKYYWVGERNFRILYLQGQVTQKFLSVWLCKVTAARVPFWDMGAIFKPNLQTILCLSRFECRAQLFKVSPHSALCVCQNIKDVTYFDLFVYIPISTLWKNGRFFFTTLFSLPFSFPVLGVIMDWEKVGSCGLPWTLGSGSLFQALAKSHHSINGQSY